MASRCCWGQAQVILGYMFQQEQNDRKRVTQPCHVVPFLVTSVTSSSDLLVVKHPGLHLIIMELHVCECENERCVYHLKKTIHSL